MEGSLLGGTERMKLYIVKNCMNLVLWERNYRAEPIQGGSLEVASRKHLKPQMWRLQ